MLLLVRLVNIKYMEPGKRLQKIPTKYRNRVKARLDKVSNQIQLKREELGVTQEELAEKLGVSSMTIQFIEQKRRYPSVQMLFYICDYLEIDL